MFFKNVYADDLYTLKLAAIFHGCIKQHQVDILRRVPSTKTQLENFEVWQCFPDQISKTQLR